MSVHQVTFVPSGRSCLAADGDTILDAARRAAEPLAAECGGRGACGRCLVRVVHGEVPAYRVVRHRAGCAEVLACLTPVQAPLTVLPLVGEDLPHLIARDRNVGIRPVLDWAPWDLPLDPIGGRPAETDLGVALDIGTTTLQLLLVRLAGGEVIAEASAYNPQIGRGADVISRIIAAEKGLLGELSSLVRDEVGRLIGTALASADEDGARIQAYVVAGNTTMIHLLLGADPSGIRQVPSQPLSLSFPPVPAAGLDWPGHERALVYTIPGAGGWVGGDIVAGIVRTGLPKAEERQTLYVDLGTNGEIVLGGPDFALACACSAGPAFEGGGIRCGMRADTGAIDGARIDPEAGDLDCSVIGGGPATGICGSGLISLVEELFAAQWIDRGGRFTPRLPERRRADGPAGTALALDPGGTVALWERDIASLLRAKAAVFAGIRSLHTALGHGAPPLDRLVVSGNFGRYLNMSAATGIGLLPDLASGRYEYIGNGSLEGAALALLSRPLFDALETYLQRVTYVDLSTLPGYMDEFVGASFLPHTSPDLLRL
jgi:uncharacterized 2Fe-2S/4Fe-4S cluster protein (DUF4445 family)